MSPTLYRSLENNTASRTLKVDYNDISLLLSQNSCTVIDVRHPEQVQTGAIPGSVNIPLSELKTACSLDEESFFMKYNAAKPSKQNNIIVLCGNGPNHAMTAFEIAYKSGYKKSTQYPGGWADWLKNENEFNMSLALAEENPALNY